MGLKQLFLDIQSHIKTNLTGIAHIAMYNNQFEHSVDNDDTYTFLMPCVFVEFENMQELKQLGIGAQIYEPLYVKLYLGIEEIDASDGTMDQNLNAFDLAQDLFKCMNKFEPNNSSIFIRFSEERDYDHRNVYIFTQTYSTSYIDMSMLEPINGQTVTNPDLDNSDTTIDITI